MNLASLKKPGYLIAIVVVALVVAAGAAFAIKKDSGDQQITGAKRDQIVKAIEASSPGGTVLKVEAEDDPKGSFEAKVKAADGTIHEVKLDKSLKVIESKPDHDAITLTAEQQSVLEASVTAALPGAKVIKVEHTTDHGATYEAEVQVVSGQTTKEYEVFLDDAFKVVFKKAD